MNAHQTRLGMRLGGPVLVVALVLASCERRNVVGPQGGHEPGGLAAAVVPGAGGVAGCARFEVSEGVHGPVSIEPVDTTATAACGSLRIRIEPPVVSGGGGTSLLVHVTNGREFVAEYTTPFPDFTTCVTEYHSMNTGALARRITQPNGGDGCTATWLTHGMRNIVPGGGSGG